MTPLDLAIVALPLLVVVMVAWWTKRYTSSVADFMAAGRCAGRYRICNAKGEAGFGAVTAVGMFEVLYNSGFTMAWWGMLSVPVGLMLAVSGFVYYRYRETRALTLAQFFEMRYSRKFRIFAGMVAFLSGLINYGIFPAVSARFFVYFCGLPENLNIMGIVIPTFVPIMIVALAASVCMAVTGGQLTIMLSDCFAGLMSGLFYLVVAVAIICIFEWRQIVEALAATPAGSSLINPFDSSGLKDFNLWYVLIAMCGTIYGCMAWQGGHAFNSSAANPHEAKMGVILGTWRSVSLTVMLALLGISAYAFLNHPDFAAQSAHAKDVIASIGNSQIQTQARVPVALGYILPIGIKGIFCALMVLAWLCCDSSYQHSWGSIFIQDVLLPLRKTHCSPKEHIRLLRLSIIGVALFGFLFSLLVRQTEYVYMFFALTGTIYLGGAGSVIIGGLYWKKGTTAGAWTGMITGSVLGISGILIKQYYPDFPFNGQTLFFFAMLAAITMYVAVSLLTCRRDFDMDRLLHRGKYAVASDLVAENKVAKVTIIGRIFGFDKEFTRGDKFISGGLTAWSLFWFFVFIVACICNLFVFKWPLSWWSKYWFISAVICPLAIGVITTIWFTWGGIRDVCRLFTALRNSKRDEMDDGTV